MNFTRRQISLIVASLVAFDEQLDKNNKMKQELNEITKILDEEYQILIGGALEKPSQRSSKNFCDAL